MRSDGVDAVKADAGADSIKVHVWKAARSSCVADVPSKFVIGIDGRCEFAEALKLLLGAGGIGIIGAGKVGIDPQQPQTGVGMGDSDGAGGIRGREAETPHPRVNFDM